MKSDFQSQQQSLVASSLFAESYRTCTYLKRFPTLPIVDNLSSPKVEESPLCHVCVGAGDLLIIYSCVAF